MKQKKFDKKLSLNKKTLVNLSGGEMYNARGGEKYTYPLTYCECPSKSCNVPLSVCICEVSDHC